ncbi:MAG: RNA 2',3'-cyclic phosphodiesterase [Betaproteobacteria bacterium HGW-Betaproteobacteria-11]|nr:MAG: RNA 2',3'-cyclic phosphodiesterase [Betaproteobacteria bacterium HGW-Betaproteobacteria-11]
MSRHRVFFALWPEPEVAEHLAALGQNLATDYGGRLTPVAQLHMTLTFIGNVTTARLDDLLALAATVRAAPIEFELDRLGFWPQGGILWAGCRSSASCQRRLFEPLHGALKAKLDAAGFSTANRSFAPHVTLARHTRCASLPRLGTPIFWRANEFSLVESVPRPLGVDYVTRASFALEER